MTNLERMSIFDKACRVRKAMERAHNNATSAKRSVVKDMYMKQYKALRSELRQLEDKLN